MQHARGCSDLPRSLQWRSTAPAVVCVESKEPDHLVQAVFVKDAATSRPRLLGRATCTPRFVVSSGAAPGAWPGPAISRTCVPVLTWDDAE